MAKSPLRAAQATSTVGRTAALRSVPDGDATSRADMLSEFALFLRTSTNRSGRPFQPRTIQTYADAVIALDGWMTRKRIAGDFTVCNAEMLNQFFRWYWTTYDKPQGSGYTGGTNTKQRNLRHLFTWMEEEYEHPHPYKSGELKRYSSPEQGKPKTLSTDFVGDMLKATGNGNPRVKDFEVLRNHAIIRVLTEGVRAEELLTLTLDMVNLEQGLVQVAPIKGARGDRAGRFIPLQPKTVLAIRRYLRARQAHKMNASEWLWLGTRNRGHLKYSGLYRMLNRTAQEAGYEAVAPHMFRHTWTDDLLSAGVSPEDVMEVGGWKDRSMLKRYAADMATSRALKAVSKLGDRY